MIHYEKIAAAVLAMQCMGYFRIWGLLQRSPLPLYGTGSVRSMILPGAPVLSSRREWLVFDATCSTGGIGWRTGQQEAAAAVML